MGFSRGEELPFPEFNWKHTHTHSQIMGLQIVSCNFFTHLKVTPSQFARILCNQQECMREKISIEASFCRDCKDYTKQRRRTNILQLNEAFIFWTRHIKFVSSASEIHARFSVQVSIIISFNPGQVWDSKSQQSNNFCYPKCLPVLLLSFKPNIFRLINNWRKTGGTRIFLCSLEVGGAKTLVKARQWLLCLVLLNH